jgi:hypothetical protein
VARMTGPMAAVLGLVLLVSACGGGGGRSGNSSSDSSSTSTTSPQGGGGRARFNDPVVQQCLASKGITLPSRGEGGDGGPPPSIDDATRQALADCGVTFGPRAGGAGGGGFNNAAVQQCLASKGITLPARGESGPRSSIDDATRQAIEACRAAATTTTTTTG